MVYKTWASRVTRCGLRPFRCRAVRKIVYNNTLAQITKQRQGAERGMAFRETFETIAGCRIRIMRGGEGEPLVFLHGASGASVWAPWMEALSAHHEVIVPEHPGFGASDTPDWLDTIGDLAYFYLDAMEALGLERVHLVGNSLGGWIALELAVRDSSRLKTLTLVAPAGIRVKGVRKGDMFLWSPEETARNLFHDKELAERMIAAMPTQEEAQMVGLKNRLMTAKLGWQPRLFNPDLHKWLHRVKVPTLILWGDDDRVIPPAYGPAFEELLPQARLQVVEACGHLPHVEKPEAFARSVTRFIEEAAS